MKPDTIAKSLAIGNPADGFQVVKVVKETGGSGAMVSDPEILSAIELLAATEGIFTEPAGGTTLAATKALIKRGVIKPNESVVVCITGNGYKTAEVMRDRVNKPVTHRPQPVGVRARGGARRRQDGDGVAVYPTFLRLAGRKVVVVGGGPVAASKLDGLLAAGAQVTVVAPDIGPELDRPGVRLVRKAFEPPDLDGAWWVVAAAPAEVNQAVLAAADARHLWVNAVDDPPNATAYLGGVVRRSDVTVAISTGGRAPALAGLLREAIDAWLPGDLDAWLEAADEARRGWKRDGVPMEQRRPMLLETLNRLYERH